MKHAQKIEAEQINADQNGEHLSLPQVMGSVFAAGFGVQSRENKVRDFSHGKPMHFIIAGITFTLGLLVALVAVVNFVV